MLNYVCVLKLEFYLMELPFARLVQSIGCLNYFFYEMYLSLSLVILSLFLFICFHLVSYLA